jgi:hypothetical protein
VFTSFNFADEPAEHDQLFTHSAWTLPLKDAIP